MVGPDLLSGRGRFVQLDPVAHQLRDDFREFRKLDWLPNVAVRAQAIAVDEILLFDRRREYSDGHKFCSVIRAHSPQHFDPIQLWQVQINQYYGGGLFWFSELVTSCSEQIVKGLESILHSDDGVRESSLVQRAHEQSFVRRTIFDHQNDAFLHEFTPYLIRHRKYDAEASSPLQVIVPASVLISR